MRNDELIDRKEITRAINTLFQPSQVFEARVIKKRKNEVYSGYFKDADSLVRAFDTIDLRGANVYVTLQQINPDCYNRSQCEQFLARPESTTSDKEIIGYDWLFIDLDSDRTSGTSATDTEMQAVFDHAKKLIAFMDSNDFEAPVKAISGNGAHLLYRVSLAAIDENIEIVKTCLKTLSLMFSDDKVKLDAVNYNPSRICKLYGTVAQKGANTKDRPHRLARIISVPDEIKVTRKDVLVRLANSVVLESQEPSQSKNYNKLGEFNIEEKLRAWGLGYSKKKWRDGATKYVLNQCPFNHEHKAPDSSIFVLNNGAIGFKCLHNSCQGKRWKDVRLMYEPDAYNHVDQIDHEILHGWEQHNRAKTVAEVPGNVLDMKNPSSDNPIFLSMNQILAIHEPDNEYLRTGIESIDYMMKGLQKGAVSVLSGLRGAAKSTILSQIMLNVINDGHNVICYSGELSSKNFGKWMLLQAAGAHHTVASNRFRNSWVIDSSETSKKIADWMEGRFWLFNNSYGNKFDRLAELLKKQANDTHADMIVLDNLMALDIGNGYDKFDLQTQFVWELKNIAKICNVHVVFVAHPRKASGFLRLNDISGSGNITNIVDNAFIIHRNNNDFDKAVSEYLGKKKVQYIPETCTNVIEVCKDRENGTQDFFIPLWYEAETKRLKNRESEHLHLGWESLINDFENNLYPF